MDPNISASFGDDEEDSFHIELTKKCTGKREKRVYSSEESPSHPFEHHSSAHRVTNRPVKKVPAINGLEKGNHARKSCENACERNGQDNHSNSKSGRQKRKWRDVPDDTHELTARQVDRHPSSFPVNSIDDVHDRTCEVEPRSRRMTYCGDSATITQIHDGLHCAVRRSRRIKHRFEVVATSDQLEGANRGTCRISDSADISSIAQPRNSLTKSWAKAQNRQQINQWFYQNEKCMSYNWWKPKCDPGADVNTSRKRAKSLVASGKLTYEISNVSNDEMCYVLSILVNILLEHNFHSLADIASLQRTCRVLHDGLHTPYFYTRILRDVYHVTFRIDPSVGPYNALRRWVTQDYDWIPLQDESSVWLSRAVDPNPIGSHDGSVYVFGGQNIRENRYSNTLFKISLRGHELIKEDIISRDMGPCGRAACGLAFVECPSERGTPASRKLYLFGGRGFGRYLDDVWCWEKNAWEMVRVSKDVPSPQKRWAHSMVGYPGGLLMYGGSAPGVLFDDLWSFRPEAGWSEIKCTDALPPSRAGQASLLHQNYLYISGGNTAGPLVETYHDVWRIGLRFPPGTGSSAHPSPRGPWEQLRIKGPTLTARIGHSIVPLNNSRIILFGGRNLSYGIKEENQFATNADVIDVETCTNAPVMLPSWLQRTGACALNHPEGIVFWGGLAPDRASIAPAVLFRPI